MSQRAFSISSAQRRQLQTQRDMTRTLLGTEKYLATVLPLISQLRQVMNKFSCANPITAIRHALEQLPGDRDPALLQLFACAAVEIDSGELPAECAA